MSLRAPAGIGAAAGRGAALAALCAMLCLSSAAATEVDTAGGTMPDRPAASYKPRPAEPSPLASRRLMLGLADTGEHLIAVGDRGHILASNDGSHWAQVVPPVRTPLMAVSFIDAQRGWAVGQDAVILRTVDGGRNWALQNFEPQRQQPLLDVLFLDAQRGLAVGGFGLMLATDDGGRSWTEIDAPAVRGDELHLYRICRLANGQLLIAGEQGLLALSVDGGRHWARLKSPAENTVFGAAALGPGAVICGLHGEAWLSDDVPRGRWRRIDTGSDASLFTAVTLDEHRVVLGGAGGRLVIIDSDGRLRSLPSPEGSTIAAIQPHAGGLVLAGERGLQWRSIAP